MIYEENEMIGKRLQKIRENAHIEYYDMAKLLGVSEGHYRKLERGIYALDVPKLLTLYSKLGVDPLYLLVGRRGMSMELNDMRDGETKQHVCELLDYCKTQISKGVEV